MLIIGYSTRYIVFAGKRAGYAVYSLDHFGDAGLLSVRRPIRTIPWDNQQHEAFRRDGGVSLGSRI